MEFNKAIKRELDRLAQMKCRICGGKLHNTGDEVISVEYLNRGEHVHQKCWDAYCVKLRLKGEKVPVFSANDFFSDF